MVVFVLDVLCFEPYSCFKIVLPKLYKDGTNPVSDNMYSWYKEFYPWSLDTKIQGQVFKINAIDIHRGKTFGDEI